MMSQTILSFIEEDWRGELTVHCQLPLLSFSLENLRFWGGGKRLCGFALMLRTFGTFRGCPEPAAVGLQIKRMRLLGYREPQAAEHETSGNGVSKKKVNLAETKAARAA